MGAQRTGFNVVLLALVLASVVWPAAAEDTAEHIGRFLEVDGAGERIAFSLISWESATLPEPILVVDRAGHVLARTSPLTDPVQHDVPIGWLGGGKELLVRRDTSGATGWDAGTSELLVVPLTDSAPQRVAFEMAVLPAAWPRIVGRDTVVCPGRPPGGEPGLYVLERENGEWRTTLLLSDSATGRWHACLWGTGTGDGYVLVAEHWEGTGPGDWRPSYWWVEESDDGQVRKRRILKEGSSIYDGCVTPDGGALLLITEGWIRRRALVVVRTNGEGRRRVLAIPEELRWIRVSPSGRQALLFDIGWADPAYESPASAAIVDLDGELTMRPLDVSGLTYLQDAEWLSDDEILLSSEEQGILIVDLASGDRTELWKPASEQEAEQGAPAD